MFLLLLLLSLTYADIQLSVKTPIKPLSIPALGRPFALGDLYDRRRDFIIPGPKLWSNKELIDYEETKTYSTNFDVSTALNVNEGLNKFDVKAAMKMSFLSGMISVSGSAAYLHDSVFSNRNARVALKYSSTTFKRSILPKTFTKATYMSVLKNVKDATDVVAAIQYGAGAVFVFDRMVQSSELKKNIEGMLKVSVKKIPSFEIHGSGAVNITKADKAMTENFMCRFHGDFVLKEHPGNYEEAIRVYKTLPSLLGESYENSVPIKIWLYPIEMLPLDKAPISLYDVQENLITYVADEMEDMENLIRQGNDLIHTIVSDRHPRIRKNVAEFQQYIKLYLMDFKQVLASLLPQIRDGSKDCHVLVELINDKQKSPFRIETLKKWITLYTEEVHVLHTISHLPGYCKDDADFSSILLNDRQYTISLTLKLSTQADKQLESMYSFLKGTNAGVTERDEHNVWWRPGQIALSNLQKYASMIKAYKDLEKQRIANGLGSNMQFVVREQILSNDQEKVEIVLDQYQNGKLQHKNLAVPNSVNNVVVLSTSHDRVKLKWESPSEGAENVIYYVVVTYVPNSAKNESRNCDEFYCAISTVRTKVNSAEVVGLNAAEKYFFAVQSFFILGKSAESFKTGTIQTTKCSPGWFHTDEHHCKVCNPGQYTDRYGAVTCLPCPRGHYSDSYTTAKCTKCPAGTYNDQTGRLLNGCTKCPEGTYSGDVGATGYSSCKVCPLGTYNSRKGQTSITDCKKCPKGSYSSNVGTMHCQLCPFGSQTERVGSASPTDCKRGEAVLGKVEKSVATLQQSADTKLRMTQIYTKGLEAKCQSFESMFKDTKSKLTKEMDGIEADAYLKFDKYHTRD